MFNYADFDYARFAMVIKSCVLQAKNKTDALEDTGTINNDMVLLSNLRNKRLDSFLEVDLPVSKDTDPGYFWLEVQNGQANRNTEFCLLLSEFLRQQGITSSVRKVMD